MTPKNVINTQIKLGAELHRQFKDLAQNRGVSIQQAGIEAIEFWITIQNQIGILIDTTDLTERSKCIADKFEEAITEYSKKHRDKKFSNDPFMNIIGKFEGDKDLSRVHDRHYEVKD